MGPLCWDAWFWMDGVMSCRCCWSAEGLTVRAPPPCCEVCEGVCGPLRVQPRISEGSGQHLRCIYSQTKASGKRGRLHREPGRNWSKRILFIRQLV